MADPAQQTAPAQAPPTARRLDAATVDDGVKLISSGRVDEARACFERVLAANPRNADACNNLGVIHIQNGNFEAAVAMFERAHSINPLKRDIRDNCVQANFEYALACTSQQRHTDAVALYRRVLALDPENMGARINLTNSLARTNTRAERSDFLVKADVVIGRHALVACMPKSGSSLMFDALHHLTGWEKAFYSYAYMQNEQELYLPYVRGTAGADTVTQQHCRATAANLQIIQGFGIRPVVLIRNLADVVMSLTDFYDQGAVFNTFLGTDWQSLKSAPKRDFIIDHIMPWYVAFYASWRRAEADGQAECCFVRYEDMIADKPATLQRIAEFLDLSKTREECQAAVTTAEGDRFSTRFNKGVAGRGKEALSDEQLARLKRLAAPYASVDFGPIGL